LTSGQLPASRERRPPSAIDELELDLATRARIAAGYNRNKKLNDELQSGAATGMARGHLLLVCECGRTDCAETIELTELEYEAARSHSRLYVVAPGHGFPGITEPITVVGRRFELVELSHVYR
jgi:hypothetical protein